MKKKTLCLLLLMPIVLVLVVFTSANLIKLPIELMAEKIVLEHEDVEFFAISETEESRYRLYAHATPSQAVNSEIVWSVDDEEIASIDKNYLVSKQKEGTVVVSARTVDGLLNASFTLEIFFDGGTEPKKVVISDPTVSSGTGIGDEKVYGLQNLVEGKLVNSVETPKVTIIPRSAPQDYKLEVVSGDATIEGKSVRFNDSGNVVVKATSITDPTKSQTYTYNVALDSVNVYDYEDLMYCTNESQEGKVVVMRTNLESIKNAYDEKGNLYKNTQLFGKGDRDKLEFNVQYIESTYDVGYLKFKNMDTKIAVAVNFKKSVYGNGFTINLHELCYENAGLALLDHIYKGPLPFIQISFVTVSGQDNIGFLVSNDNVTVSNISLRNSNAVTDLTYLDYVGTTLEVMGDNVTIKNSILSNGLTVLRSFSNENLLIDGCLLQMAREFIFKLGSNTVIKPTNVPANVASLPISEKYNILSPKPFDDEGNLLSDSSAIINNSYFYRSGFFSIGLDTHFAGEVLHNGNYSGCKYLAATSYASRLTISGDTRFYDWKSIEGLDSSTLIKINAEGVGGSSFDPSSLITDMVKQAASAEMEIEKDGKTYLHGGIAFFGGGRNESTITFTESGYLDAFYLLDNVTIQGFGNSISDLVSTASGYGAFKFYTYNATSRLYYNEQATSDEDVNMIPQVEAIIPAV